MITNKLCTVLLAAGSLLSTAAFAVTPPYPAGSIHAVAHFGYTQGSVVPAGRDLPIRALFAPQHDRSTTSNANSNYVALGFGGSIILQVGNNGFSANPAGADLIVVETSFGNPGCDGYPEYVKVEVSDNVGGPWELMGQGCQNGPLATHPEFGSLAVEFQNGRTSGKFVKLTDETNPADFGGSGDGYDVDGVVAYVAGPTVCTAVGSVVVSFDQGTLKNGNPIGAARSMTSKVTTTEASDAQGPVNFVSLGYDKPATAVSEGVIVISLASLFYDDGTDAADLAAWETSWGDKASKTCQSYPEKAQFFGSYTGLDGSWVALRAVKMNGDPQDGLPNAPFNQLCRDGYLDLSPMPETAPGSGIKGISFIKVVNATALAGGTPDAYDLDGFTSASCPKTTGNNNRDGIEDESGEISEMEDAYEIEISPNPVAKGQVLDIEMIMSVAGSRTVDVIDATGRLVTSMKTGKMLEGANNISLNISTSLKSGVYILRVTGQDNVETKNVRFVVID